ncbi:hypothetical protein K8R43_02455 [archaeon]|nr:hypothetical protein [archaeon]
MQLNTFLALLLIISSASAVTINGTKDLSSDNLSVSITGYAVKESFPLEPNIEDNFDLVGISSVTLVLVGIVFLMLLFEHIKLDLN